MQFLWLVRCANAKLIEKINLIEISGAQLINRSNSTRAANSQKCECGLEAKYLQSKTERSSGKFFNSCLRFRGVNILMDWWRLGVKVKIMFNFNNFIDTLMHLILLKGTAINHLPSNSSRPSPSVWDQRADFTFVSHYFTYPCFEWAFTCADWIMHFLRLRHCLEDFEQFFNGQNSSSRFTC